MCEAPMCVKFILVCWCCSLTLREKRKRSITAKKVITAKISTTAITRKNDRRIVTL